MYGGPVAMMAILRPNLFAMEPPTIPPSSAFSGIKLPIQDAL